MRKLLEKIFAYNENEIDNLESIKTEICQQYNDELFWYISSGIDPTPFYHFEDVDVYLYSDYNKIIMDNLYKAYDRWGPDNETLCWTKRGFITKSDNDNREYQPDLLRDLFIEEIIPINVFSSEELNDIKQHKKYKTIGKIGNSPHGFIIHIAGSFYEFMVIFLNFENLLVYNEIIEPFNLKLKYLCSVTDGCAKGGNWECSNQEDSNFFKTIINGKVQPDYWITDHNWRCNRYFNKILKKNLWNGRYGKVNLFVFKQKTYDRYLFEKENYTLTLINDSILSCLNSIEKGTLLVISNSLCIFPEEEKKLEDKGVIVHRVRGLKLLNNTVDEWLSLLNELANRRGVTKVVTMPFGEGKNSSLLEMDKSIKNLVINKLIIYYIDNDDYLDIRNRMKRVKYE